MATNHSKARYPAQVSGGKLWLFFLIGLFLLVAPLSVSGSTSREGDDWLKWTRVGILVLISFSGLKWFRWPRMQDLGGKLILVALVFWASAIWSTSPYWGLAFKGMFLASIFAGLSLANAMRSEPDFRRFARMITIASVAAVLGVAYFSAIQERELMFKGRLYLAAINPNLLSQSAAVFALLNMFHLVVGDVNRWQTLAYACLGAMLLLVVLSGSRSAALMLLAGVVILLPALGRRRRQTFVLASLSLLVLSGFAVFLFSSADTTDELESGQNSMELRIVDELTKDTRLGMWTRMATTALREPIIGVGWLHRSNRWSTVQSAYLQVFIEAGALGALPLLAFLVTALQRVVETMRLAKRQSGLESSLPFVFAATLFALLFHALFESSAVTGASPIAVLLGFCVGQVDRYVRVQRNSALADRDRMSPSVGLGQAV